MYTAVATSETTSNTTLLTGSSNVSGNSQFSAASGGDGDSPSGQILPLPNLRMFSFSELKTATRNFRSDTVLGEGGFGKVYKGWLDEKGTTKGGSATVIAVKKLNTESFQGFEEWQVIQICSLSNATFPMAISHQFFSVKCTILLFDTQCFIFSI